MQVVWVIQNPEIQVYTKMPRVELLMHSYALWYYFNKLSLAFSFYCTNSVFNLFMSCGFQWDFLSYCVYRTRLFKLL